MKNSIRIISIPVILFLILIISGCEEKTKIRTGGVSDLYSFIPEDVSGFLLLNVDKFSKLESYEKMFQEDKAVMAPPGYAMFKNYHDFVRKTGIDPKKDIHSIAFLLFEGSDDKEKSVVVSRSDYTKEKVIELIKREGGKFSAEKYHDMDLFRFTVENEEIGLSFIDEKTIIGGCPERVKQVIDLSKGKGKNILSDKAREPFLKKFEPDSIALFLFNISDKLKAISQKSNMSFVSMDLSKAELVFGFIDYDKRSWNGEIRLISHNDEGNKQTVNSLNMIKGMGALAGPEVAELLNNINITSSSEDIRLTFKISDELLEKVKKKTEEKMLFQNR